MAWLTGYLYRKAVVIGYSVDAALTSYQMKLRVRQSSGSAAGDVLLNGHVLDSFNNLRFTNLTGTNLPYWVESITGSSGSLLATVWINVDSIPQSNTTIYLYYGNSGASAVSSGYDTFIVYDGFEWGANGDHIHSSGGGTIWTSTNTAIISTDVTSGVFAGSTGTQKARLKGDNSVLCSMQTAITASNSIALRYRYYKEDATVFYVTHGDGSNALDIRPSDDEKTYVFNGASWVDTTLAVQKDVWGLIEAYNFNWGAATCTLKIDAGTKTGIDISYAGGYTNLLYFEGLGGATYDTWIDDVIVRKWTTNEPTWSSFGAEEMFYLNPQNIYPHILVR